MNLSPEYLAGFFDGEGCVNITRSGKTLQTVLRVYLTNTDLNILRLIHSQHGGRIPKEQNLNPQRGWKPYRCVDMRGPSAAAFLRFIYPFVVIKKPQVELALKFWEFMQSPMMDRCEVVFTPTENAPWHVTRLRKKETVEKELNFKNQMHLLNKKGIALSEARKRGYK